VGEAELPDADRNQLLAEYARTLADFHTVASDSMADGPTMIDIVPTNPPERAKTPTCELGTSPQLMSDDGTRRAFGGEHDHQS
jgi:hypothetical protein